MALPAGITTATVTAGVPVTFSGLPVRANITITPSAFLVHTATGNPLVNMIEEVAATDGVAVQFTLPHTDQDGFQDEAGNAYKNWYYTASIQYANDKATKAPFTKVFQLAAGQTTVDLDLLPSGNAAMPYSAPLPTVSSVNGQIGAVTVPATTDSDVAAFVQGSGPTATALNATILARETAPKLRYLDLYTGFFGGSTNRWVTGQTNTATTVTAAVSGGATVLPFASVTNVVAGMVYVVHAGTASQQFLTVASVAANNVTMTGALTTALANGATVTPLWTDTSHLTAAGYSALGQYLTTATDPAGNLILGAPPAGRPVTLLGNSWIFGGANYLEAEILQAYPTATVVKAGVSGNTSAQLIARFDTDVPANSSYVIFNEPGVNDTNLELPLTTLADNLQKLFVKCRSIGAIPIYMGPVPLVTYLAQSITNATSMAALVGDGTTFPATPTKGVASALEGSNLVRTPAVNTNTAVGLLAMAAPTGDNNTVAGYGAAGVLTTGFANVAVGRSSLNLATTAAGHTAIGYNTLAAMVSGTFNTAVGHQAGASSTGNRNTYIGFDAGRAPAGVSANASTTGQNQTIIGAQSGQGGSSPKSNITTLGYGTTVTQNGGVAIGTDDSGVGASSADFNEFVLGTANHTVRIKGYSQLDGGQRVKVTVPGAYPYPALDTDYIIAVATSGGARGVTLPAANAAKSKGQVIIVKDSTGQAATNPITITPNGANTIDGAATYVVNTARGSVRLVSDSSANWLVL